MSRPYSIRKEERCGCCLILAIATLGSMASPIALIPLLSPLDRLGEGLAVFVVTIIGTLLFPVQAYVYAATWARIDERLEVRRRRLANPCPTGAPPIAHLAGKRHPETGIPFDADGYPDFSSVSIETVTIRFADPSNRALDATTASAVAGLRETPEGYTWNYHRDGTTMQLVPSDIHRRTGRAGGFFGPW